MKFHIITVLSLQMLSWALVFSEAAEPLQAGPRCCGDLRCVYRRAILSLPWLMCACCVFCRLAFLMSIVASTGIQRQLDHSMPWRSSKSWRSRKRRAKKSVFSSTNLCSPALAKLFFLKVTWRMSTSKMPPPPPLGPMVIVSLSHIGMYMKLVGW